MERLILFSLYSVYEPTLHLNYISSSRPGCRSWLAPSETYRVELDDILRVLRKWTDCISLAFWYVPLPMYLYFAIFFREGNQGHYHL
ncbi:hypothetical protein Y032_0137g1992 [Ancylostoma ceylanicum]|uniref:Uncharacterized protein n=1 Tax=Ancylostoma ceylanicum TaxID=53326 RepID=A0A016T4X6_9BILA|nr:hypothetical protein Y032_0137g1992 [Ancylostoma ceylanicum]